jgi:hypothetical protein
MMSRKIFSSLLLLILVANVLCGMWRYKEDFYNVANDVQFLWKKQQKKLMITKFIASTMRKCVTGVFESCNRSFKFSKIFFAFHDWKIEIN